MTAAISDRERVAKGAAFLDEHDPDWWRADVERAINLDTLCMSSTEECILGQRCPLEVLAARVGTSALADTDFCQAYDAYVRHLSGLTGADVIYWARDHGFTLGDLDFECDRHRLSGWASLAAEWKRVITGRRAAA